jgi:hypothetical protein
MPPLSFSVFSTVRRPDRSAAIAGLVRLVLAAGLVLALTRCDWSSAPVEGEALVVEAFLETERPLPAVDLRRTRSLRASARDSVGGAAGATVRVELGGTTYTYEETGRPGRYRPRSAPSVPPNVPWRLTARWNGTTARARGTTPPPISVTEVCVDVSDAPIRAVQVDSLRRDSLDIPADVGYIYPVDVTVRWKDNRPASVPDTSTWVRAQLRPDATPFPSEVVEFFLQPAEIRREDAYPRSDETTRWRGVYAVPVDSSAAPLPRHNLTTALVRGDTAFAAFAQTRTDPDRREPISNVNGALGIATAVSVDSLVRSVEPDMARCRAAPTSVP